MTNAIKKTAASPQALLGLRLDEKTLHSLDRFYPGSANRLALDSARAFARGLLQKTLVITGKPKSGKTHLLRGVFHAWHRGAGENVFFFDAKQDPATLPRLDRLEKRKSGDPPALVCIDDLDLPAGDPETLYESVFGVFNRLAESGGFLAATLRGSPANTPGLPGYLSSRLLTGMVVNLQRPDEAGMGEILGKMADDRSISLTPGARSYVLNRCGRSIGDLLALVDRLEAAMPPASRRVGLQLLRRVIN